MQRSSRLRLLAIPLLAGCALAVYVAALAIRIEWQSHRNQARPADAIVVFGAAEYDGRPSPVLRARLQYALTLYRQGLAPRIVVTGGSGGDAEYTEGGVGARFLRRHGVPAAAVWAETRGYSTADSARRVARWMLGNGWRQADVVSDGYHLFRACHLLEDDGVRAYGAPRPPLPGDQPWKVGFMVLREAVGYTLFQLHLVR